MFKPEQNDRREWLTDELFGKDWSVHLWQEGCGGREGWVALVEENLTFTKYHSFNVPWVDVSLLDDSEFPCVSNINTLWLRVDWKLAKAISFDERLVLLWRLCKRFTSTVVLKVPFPLSWDEITSTRWKSPLKLTFTTYMTEKSTPKRLNNNNRRNKAKCKMKL